RMRRSRPEEAFAVFLPTVKPGETIPAPMIFRRLGRTGLKISRLALGCGNFGGIGSAPAFYGMGETEAQAAALLDRALDAGVNLLHTADAYGRRRRAHT